MKNIILIIVLIIATATISLGQSASWNYRVNSGNLGVNYSWIDCTDGTELKSSNLNRGNLDDGRWNINWPFNFKVYGNNYNTSNRLSISTNGFIRFDGNADYNNWAAARDYVLAAAPSTDFGQILCYGISDVSFTASNSRVFTKVTGAAPNRVFTIEFVQMGYYWAAGIYGDVQVSFYETSNNIVIKAGNNNVTYEGAEIGLHSGVSPYFHYWQDVDNASGNTWIEYIPSVATSYDITSYVRPPASQPANTSFPASATGSGTAHDVLSFKITDAGGDGLPTKISKIRIKNAYPANRADWTDCIAGVVLNDGSRDLNLGVTTIDDNYIDFLFNIDEFDVPDGTTLNFTLKIYLKAGTAIEGKTMQFYIDDNNHGWFYDQMGSGLLSNFGNASDIKSNVFTYTITASQLAFTVNPANTIHQNNEISPVVTVEAQDGAGNKDANFNGTVSLSNSGGLSMTNNTASIVNGVATFTNLQFSQTGGPITLSTSNTHGLTDGTSTETTVAILNVLFSDDFEDATQSQLDWTVSGTTNVWQVGDQTNDAWGPPSGHSANGVYGTYLNAGYNNNVSAYLESPIIDLAGSSDPKVKFWMDMESQVDNDGGTVQIRVKPNASSPWGNYYTLSMSDAGYSGNIPNDTDVDGLSNNEDGWSGNSPDGEWAEVQIDLFNLNTSGLNAIDASSLIQVRFWFGTDNNSRNFPGWYIDDFEVSYTSFPGLWSTSAATIDWGTASNWDDGIVPDGIFVTIPAGAANYPLIDETANASNLLIKDGAELVISTGGSLNLTGDLFVGQGTTGSFEINDGSCILAGDLYTNSGSTTTISGGDIQFTNWAKSTTAEFAEGNINLSSGTITASGNVMFADANLNGTMAGDFTLNVAGNFSISDNVWAVPTGGTIILSATSPLLLEALNGNALTAYNLQIANTGGVTLSSSANILNNLEVSETTLITVPPSVNLQVTGDFTLHASDKKSAALIDNENVIVSGVSTVEISTSANVFQYISSPVSAAPTTLFTKAPWGANNYNFYIYNEANTNANWAYGWVRPAAGTLASAKGYAYYLTSPYIHKVNGGHFNTGNISIPVYNSGTNPSNSWNLIGNPYPSPLNADDFISANANADPAAGLLTGTIYFWDDDGSDGSDYASADYATYNLAGSVGGGSGKTSNGFISIGQAFFVQANNNGNVAFTNSMRSETQGVSFKSAPSAKAVNKNIL
ncbi:MAG: hypothetical protein P1P88_18375, partial [Bacteroidales bacterium]|nr:hypothetical protein [Bacteroidales bacterium]